MREPFYDADINIDAGYEYRKGDTITRQRKIGRNDTCPCGSGKKYKRCHLPKRDYSLVKALGAHK